MMCSICRRGPAWGIKLFRVGTMKVLPSGDSRDFSGVLSCEVDMVDAVNVLVQEGGVDGVDPQYRRLVKRVRWSVIENEAAA